MYLTSRTEAGCSGLTDVVIHVPCGNPATAMRAKTVLECFTTYHITLPAGDKVLLVNLGRANDEADARQQMYKFEEIADELTPYVTLVARLQCETDHWEIALKTLDNRMMNAYKMLAERVDKLENEASMIQGITECITDMSLDVFKTKLDAMKVDSEGLPF